MADVVVNPENCKDPKELFAQGARAFILRDFETAVIALSKTSELLVEEHKDDLHSSLGEVYLYYGQSLLGLVREENEPLGDAVPKDAEEESDDEDEDDAEDEKDVTANGTDKKPVDGKATVEEGKEEKSLPKIDESVEEVTEKLDNKKDDETATATSADDKDSSVAKENKVLPEASSSSVANTDEAGPSKEKVDDGESTKESTTEDQDPSDLQVAWEVLELAKKIFDRDGDKKHLAETLISLGELSLENENFQAAADDIKVGLEMQKELFSNDNRTVAESFYKLGMAYSMQSQTDEAVANFNFCLDYLRNRITTLQKKEVQDEETKSEIEEIQNLIPDIEEKITDVKNYKEEAIKKLTESLKDADKPVVTTSSNAKVATDISHLVKRKRKIDENGTEEHPTKKPAVDS